MKRELTENIPCNKFKHHRNIQDIWNNIKTYTFSASSFLGGHPRKDGDEETIEKAKTVLADLVKWTETNSVSLVEAALLEHCTSMRARLDPLLHSLCSPTVDSICAEMVDLADEYAKRLLYEDPKALAKELFLWDSKAEVSVVVRPHRSMNGIKELIMKYDQSEDVQQLNQTHLTKLKELFNLHCTKPEAFESSVWCLLRRYKSFFGLDRFEGFGLQAALPPGAFQMLHNEFSVSIESFASPLNCYFTRYCSAFIDTDAPFGSLGSFYNFKPKSGSFEANPPFTEELMELMVSHIEQLLTDAGDSPLSFAIFIPEWLDPPTPALVKMRDNCKFTTREFVIGENAHKYVSGGQHNAAPHQRMYNAVHGTHVFFLQNEAGKQKWDPTVQGKEQRLANVAHTSGSPRPLPLPPSFVSPSLTRELMDEITFT